MLSSLESYNQTQWTLKTFRDRLLHVVSVNGESPGMPR